MSFLYRLSGAFFRLKCGSHLRYLSVLAALLISLTALSFCASNYQEAVLYPVGAAPAGGTESVVQLAAVDVNGDGRDDLIAASQVTSSFPVVTGHISVLLANPDGTFKPAIVTATAAPVQFIVKDLNGDGIPDLVLLSSSGTSSDRISVFIGKGDGTFNSPVNYALPGISNAGNLHDQVLVLADANGDGKPDLITFLLVGSKILVTVLLGNGNGTFQTPVTSASASSSGRFVVGDFDNDGKLDIFTPGQTFLGNGDGTFQPPIPQGAGGNGIDIVAGDFNGDGKLDVRIDDTSCEASQIYGFNSLGTEFLGNGDGTFQPGTCVTSQAQVSADFNGDGKLDGVYFSYYLGIAGVDFEASYLTGSPDQVVTFLTNLPGNGGICCYGGPGPVLVAGNFYGNGHLGLAAASTSDNHVAVLLGNGNGNFQAQQQYPSGSSPGAIAVGDFNNDGFQDQLIANRSDNTITELLSRGNGTFREYTIATGHNPQGIAVGDFNSDGFEDFAVTNANDNTVSVYLGNGTGFFAAPVTYPVGTDPRSIQAEDFNGDGKLDLVTVNKLSNTTSVLLGNGDGTFQTAYTFSVDPGPVINAVSSATTLSSPREVAVGDLNLDGYPDLAVVNEGSNTVSVLLNDKTGHFPTSTNYQVGTSPLSIAIGDLNNDGKPDLIVANSGSNNMTVLLGNGDGTFAVFNTFSSAGTTPAWVTLLDATNNGKLDAVVANSGSNALSIFYGNGDGTFQQPPVNYTVGVQPQYTHSGNFSGGGVFDLSAANNLSNTISVLLNSGVAVTQLVSSGASVFGQQVTFTATVKSTSSGATTPTGTVTFSDAGATLATVALSAGSASYTTGFLTLNAGTHTITATYSGDSRYFSNSTNLIQVVSKATVVLATSAGPNPSTYGQKVTFNVGTSTPGLPSGTMSFSDGSTLLATITLSGGNASFSTSTLAAGMHSIQIAYSGDGNHLPAGTRISQTVNQATTTTAVVSSHNPSTVGETVTFTVSVTPGAGAGTPTGSVMLFDGASQIGSAMLNASGQALIPIGNFTFGMHSITATYNGDSNFLTSTSSAITQNVLHATTTTVSSPGAVNFGQQVTFTATVTSSDPGTPTGMVTFYDDNGTVVLGVGTLNGGSPDQATFTTALNQPLAAGAHIIIAVYKGDSSFGSSAVSLTQTVNSVSGFSIGLLTHVPQPVVHIGQQGTFTATLSNQSGAAVNNIVFSFRISGGRGYFVGASFTTSSGGTASCDISNQPLTCNIGTMNTGDAATITITGVPTLAYSLTATAGVNATTQTAVDIVRVRFRPFRK